MVTGYDAPSAPWLLIDTTSEHLIFVGENSLKTPKIAQLGGVAHVLLIISYIEKWRQEISAQTHTFDY